MSIPDEELRSEREFTKELITEDEADFDRGEIPRDRVHLMKNSLGSDYRELGVISSLLGDKPESRKNFSEATDYYLSGIRIARDRRNEIKKGNWQSEPTILLDALYCAPLSNDDDLLTEVAREILDMDDEYVTEFPDTVYKYYAAKALAAVVLDADDARTYIQSLHDALDGVRPELTQFFGGIGTVADGILTDDGKTVADGVDQLLDNHASAIQGEPTTTTDAVSLPATGLVALARHCGTDVPIESDYLLPLVETDA